MIEIETSIAQCHHGCGISELGMSRHAFRLQLWLNEFHWVEPLHFSGDLALEFGRVKKGDWPDSASSGKKRLPKGIDTDAVRSQNPNPSYDHPIFFSHL